MSPGRTFGEPAPTAAPSLNLVELPVAAARNVMLAGTLGWGVLYPAIASWILRLGDGATPLDFAQAVAGWQGRNGLTASGVLDDATWRRMLREVKAGIPRPFTTTEGVRRPHGLTEVVSTFGDPTRPGWESANLTRITAPAGRFFISNRATTRVHRLLAPHFNRLFAAVEAAGLWPEIFPSAGTFVCRTKQGFGKKPCGSPGISFNQLSTHSWGITIDVRANDYPFYTAKMQSDGRRLGQPPPRITRIFQEHGFQWGMWFLTDRPRIHGRIGLNGADPMHFQFATGF
jgi:hypothetical protein